MISTHINVHKYIYLGVSCLDVIFPSLFRTYFNVDYRWYTTNCPNLDTSRSHKSFDVNTELTNTGGENSKNNVNGDNNDGCPSHLRSCAYLCYAHDSYGVAVVPTSLWKVSQKAEADLWAVNGGSRLGRDFQNLYIRTCICIYIYIHTYIYITFMYTCICSFIFMCI